MKRFNLSDWALNHRSFVWFLMIISVVAGALAYMNIGREEDPDFSIKVMVIAGILPGALMVLGMMTAAFIICTLNGWGILIRLSFSRVIKTGIGAWLGFFAIILVLWCIYTGKASPTEAAAVGAFGATILTIFQKKFSLEILKAVMRETTLLTSMVFMILISGTCQDEERRAN